MIKQCLFAISALTITATVNATDLMDIYQQALDNDPTFKQAYSTYMSSREALPIAMAALMPQFTLTGQSGRNFQSAAFNPSTIGGIFANKTDYNYKQYTINASQAIFNYQAWKQVSTAKASIKQAQALFNAAAQSLIIRTSQAYFNVLLARDTLNYSRAKKRANSRQLEQARQRFKVGLDAITSVYEAEAAYDSSVAEVIGDENNLTNEFENLRILTNHTYKDLAPLRNQRVPLIRPEPANMQDWINTSLSQNYTLLAAKYSVIAARETIKATAAGNWPTLSAVGATSDTQNDISSSVSNVAKRSINSGLYLSLNFPVFQGGLVVAQTNQSKYDFQATNEAMQLTYRQTLVGSHNAFNTVITGISKVKADRQTIISQTNSLESTEAQFKVGTRTMVDVVDAQENLFLAQRQLATDQYAYILSILTLKELAGTLNVQDIEEINSWLKTTRYNRAMKRPAPPKMKPKVTKKAPLKKAIHTTK